MRSVINSAVMVVGPPEKYPDIVYATNFNAPDPVVFLHKGTQRYLVVSSLELGRARKQALGVEVLTTETLGVRKAHRRRTANVCAALLRRTGTKSVHVPHDFPHGLARGLQQRGIQVRLLKTMLYPQRAIKTREELAKIRQSQQAAVIAMRSAIAAIAQTDIHGDGRLYLKNRLVTAGTVRRLIARVLIDHDCVARDTIVACGAQAADPHEKGYGPLKAHEPIVIDIFPQHTEHGYWGDLTRTVVRGEASKEVRRMFHAVRAAHHAALNQVRSRVWCMTVHHAAAAELQERGFRTGLADGRPSGFIHSTGHGVGLSIHEEPSIGENASRLRVGNVITIEPGLYYPGLGGMRIEDTVVVTPSGWCYLVPCEKQLELRSEPAVQ